MAGVAAWIGAIAAAACAGPGTEVCVYEGERARCGILVVQLAGPVSDLRGFLEAERGRVVSSDDEFGLAVAAFDGDANSLADTLARLRQHPSVRSADYDRLAVADAAGRD